MNNQRRDFLKKALLLTGMAGIEHTIPTAIQRALAIEPIPGSTFMDAEHVVILMQENRSFDHGFGTLQGVRGFNDPRYIRLPNGNPVWFQPDKQGNAFVPFRLNLMDSKSTWMGAVPHSRHSQVDAFNEGRYDNWIEAKRVGKNYAHMPLTMGYYNRQDIPFNYALADAFTICDQHFCSAMTSTWPNRFFFWTGTVRTEQDKNAKAEMRNELPFGGGKWPTFPELLEDAGVPWKIYQNDVSCGGGFSGEERSWLASFSCNPLERFQKYNVQFSDRYVANLKIQADKLPKEIAELEQKQRHISRQDKQYNKTQDAIDQKKKVLKNAKQELKTWSPSNFDKLSQREKKLYQKAFITNSNDPDYRRLDKLEYIDYNGKKQKMDTPKGDILHQFRQDVQGGELPTVSWLIPAQRYSDHPSSPWYGSWYISEIIDILTQNPKIWQKTIFILTYDENDGYFDHVPPFTPPNPYVAHSGKCSAGIDPAIEYITAEQELAEGRSKKTARTGPIGLGYRVPMIVASPWSKGGKVCSQVFDHTSTLQFLEKFLSHKFNRDIASNQISDWRRTICGDLTSIFSEAKQKKANEKLPFLNRDSYLENIHQTQHKALPTFGQLTGEDLMKGKTHPHHTALMPKQENGIRPSCPLPYELYVEGKIEEDAFDLNFHVDNAIFGNRSSGAPFTVYANGAIRQYAVKAGDTLSDKFTYTPNQGTDIHVHGPNGFFRRFKNKHNLVPVSCSLKYEQQEKNFTGKIQLLLENKSQETIQIYIRDKGYGQETREIHIPVGERHVELVDLQASQHWYDLEITVNGYPDFLWGYAGRVETDRLGYTDPQIAKVETN
ncbi:phosphocholine-specific phospholipase C [Sphingobacterium arenae]|uniref:phospholipase C n=1 Tax=Sphingobacterium arenae TaxID=1280598 RepID=A0ABR7XZV8_9SPHI|nr:phospholipase C, phosphocholine-specific [Sphingobacterium arenae]MBD1424578.1 phospholipase C, phosphocholine-specific [Sphingobacterium arenae]